jgi:membrane protein
MGKIKNLHMLGEHYEGQSFFLIKSIFNRLIDGLFLFKKRKGEVVAGATTFFTLLSFGPAMLLLISVLGFYLVDNDLAKLYLLKGIKLSFPTIDPWIYNNIKDLLENQLNKSSGFSLFQIILLVLGCMGISTSIVFGINTMSKIDPDGGLIGDDLRSIVTGFCVSFFLIFLILLVQKNIILDILSQFLTDKSIIVFTIQTNTLPCLLSLLFFTCFYRYSTKIYTKWIDSFYGALTFVSCFLVGKSSYWLYLNYFKQDFVNDYGHFYRFMIALIWVYFLLCAFYYGAAVAYVADKKLLGRNKASPSKKRGKK